MSDTLYVEPAEMELFFFLNGTSGSFSSALFDAIFKADPENRSKLKKGFPSEVQAVSRYVGEDGYWEDLIYRMKQL